MSRRATSITSPNTVSDCLQGQNVDMLMALAKLLPETSKVPRRKPDLPAVEDSKQKEPAPGRWKQPPKKNRALSQRDTERAAQQDLIAILNLTKP